MARAAALFALVQRSGPRNMRIEINQATVLKRDRRLRRASRQPSF
jgi:hypothetical protein